MTINEKHKFILLAIAIILAIIFLDQLTKILALKFLPTVCNLGVAFGLFQNAVSALVPLAIIFILIFFGIKFTKDLLLGRIGMIMIVAGGISNLLDRLLRGCVVDFVDFKIWPSFNFADVAICMGVVVLVFSLLKYRHE